MKNIFCYVTAICSFFILITSLKLSMVDKLSKRVAIVGSTGYIGKFVVKESNRRGYNTFAIVRFGR